MDNTNQPFLSIIISTHLRPKLLLNAIDSIKQQDGFDGKHSKLDFGNPNFETLAEAYGLWGRKITAADQLVSALEEAFQQDGPALIAVPVDYAENRKLTARLGEIEVPS